MKIKTIVFDFMQEGEVVWMTPADFSDILCGNYEITYNKHQHYFPNIPTEVIVNEEGVLLGLPRNRGYHGTFIVVKKGEQGEYESFTDDEIQTIKNVLDKKKNFESLNESLATFFEKEDIPVELFEYERKGCYVALSNYDVIERILSSKDIHFLQRVEEIVRRIAYSNGNINHFLYHMGHAIVEEIVKSHEDFLEA